MNEPHVRRVESRGAATEAERVALESSREPPVAAWLNKMLAMGHLVFARTPDDGQVCLSELLVVTGPADPCQRIADAGR